MKNDAKHNDAKHNDICTNAKKQGTHRKQLSLLFNVALGGALTACGTIETNDPSPQDLGQVDSEIESSCCP